MKKRREILRNTTASHVRNGHHPLRKWCWGRGKDRRRGRKTVAREGRKDMNQTLITTSSLFGLLLLGLFQHALKTWQTQDLGQRDIHTKRVELIESYRILTLCDLPIKGT